MYYLIYARSKKLVTMASAKTLEEIREMKESIEKRTGKELIVQFTDREAKLLAVAFIDEMHKEISADEMQELIELTEKKNIFDTCYSHNYCDSNMVMLEAFNKTEFGKDEDFEQHLPLFNRAWYFALKKNFQK